MFLLFKEVGGLEWHFSLQSLRYVHFHNELEVFSLYRMHLSL